MRYKTLTGDIKSCGSILTVQVVLLTGFFDARLSKSIARAFVTDVWKRFIVKELLQVVFEHLPSPVG